MKADMSGLAGKFMQGPAEVVTPRLRLRMWDPESADSAAYGELCSSTEVMRFLRDGKPLSLHEAAANVQTMRGHWEKHGFGQWAVDDLASGQLVGTAGFCHANTDDDLFPLRAEICVVVGRPFWGRGFGTELAIACRKAAVGMGVWCVYGVADRRNSASIATMRRAGMDFVTETMNRGRLSVVYAYEQERWVGEPAIEDT